MLPVLSRVRPPFAETDPRAHARTRGHRHRHHHRHRHIHCATTTTTTTTPHTNIMPTSCTTDITHSHLHLHHLPPNISPPPAHTYHHNHHTRIHAYTHTRIPTSLPTVAECACVVELKLFIDPPADSPLPNRTKMFKSFGFGDVPIWVFILDFGLILTVSIGDHARCDGLSANARALAKARALLGTGLGAFYFILCSTVSCLR